MIVGCYSMHLYCDKSSIAPGEVYDDLGHIYHEFPHEFSGRTEAECKKSARERGWKFTGAGEAHCPKCTKANP